MRISSKQWITCAALAGAVMVLPVFACGSASAQYLTRSEFAPPLRIAPVDKFRAGIVKRPQAVALQSAPAPVPGQHVGPVAIPASDPNTPFGRALAACDKLAEGFDVGPLPGARGEVKLDRCYRGRNHFVCTFGVLLSEAGALLDKYKRITEANYPEVGNLEQVCKIKPDALASDLEAASDFSTRFRALQAQYDARVACGASVEQSFREVTLSDMTQAPDVLKSMIDTIEGDMKGVTGAEAEVAGLAGGIDASQKAMSTIQKIHRAMCAKNQVLEPNSPKSAGR